MMDQAAIRSSVIAEIRRIAPELEESELMPDRPLRDQVDLDSMDWLNFILALHDRFKIEIPEADYKKLGTLQEIVTYLASKQA